MAMMWRRGAGRSDRTRGKIASLVRALSAFALLGLLWPSIPGQADEAGPPLKARHMRGGENVVGWQTQEAGAAIGQLKVTKNKSRTVKLGHPFSSIQVGNPALLDVLPISDREMYLQGKAIGTTNVSLFDDKSNLISIIDVEVAVDTSILQEQIRSSGPDSRAIRVGSASGKVILAGLAGTAVAAERAVQLARSYATDPSCSSQGQQNLQVVTGNAAGGAVASAAAADNCIINAMTVAPAQQVMLKVRFYEATRDASRELGVNWFGANNLGNRGFNTGLGNRNVAPGGRPGINNNCVGLNSINPLCVDASGGPQPNPPNPARGAPGLPIFQTAGTLLSNSTPFGVAIAGLLNKGASVDLVLSALETKGLVRRLAEPDLVALSGDTAAFLAGGEFPVPSVQPGGAGAFPIITTDFKPFGVQLTFLPTVLADGIINLRLTPSVSELDFVNAIVVSGFTIPSLIKREARTTIELRDGQSFAIAGLLSTDNRRDVSQLPWIGSVPVLGALFGSKAYRQQETDLVVIVTPHIVAPAVPGQRLATPLDNTIPTNDVDFFLWGSMELRKSFTEYVTVGGDVQGPYGHMLRTSQGPVILSSKY